MGSSQRVYANDRLYRRVGSSAPTSGTEMDLANVR
jgi:hypothetical protein